MGKGIYERAQKPITWVVDEKTGCWNCDSHSINERYPHKKIPGTRKTINIHRYLYEVLFGILPDDIVVRHKCDNTRCINPEHLLEGTTQDNMNDKVQRGRVPSGEDNGNSKLTKDAVLFIHANRHLMGKTLASKFNVSLSAIKAIRARKTWKQLQIN